MGRNFVTTSIALTPEQITFLKTLPDSGSKVIRGILDDLMKAKASIGEAASVISLNKQLEVLLLEKERLNSEKGDFYRANWDHWKKYGDNTPIWDKTLNVPIALEDKNSQVALKVLIGYSKAISNVEQRIEETKVKILQN